VVDLPTDLIDPSFVTDRLARTGDAAYGRLVESIRESGQQVPILVRPHPTELGRYQIAYGHRRHAALADLGMPVRAIVRQLNDAELVVAQGKENGERRDLSFIERALFAAELERRGFDRATLIGALGVHTAEITRLLAVATAVPAELVLGIGPAPKAGRLRWLELAQGLARAGVMPALLALLAEPSIRNLPSDRRFEAVMRAVRAEPLPPEEATSTIVDSQGRAVVRITRSAAAVRLTIDEKTAPGFGDLVVQELGRLIGRYGAERG
jgi:ParB family chromosome partitioning protein